MVNKKEKTKVSLFSTGLMSVLLGLCFGLLVGLIVSVLVMLNMMTAGLPLWSIILIGAAGGFSFGLLGWAFREISAFSFKSGVESKDPEDFSLLPQCNVP